MTEPQEPSATPSTLERLQALATRWERTATGLDLMHLTTQAEGLRSSAEELRAALRPSEGPPTLDEMAEKDRTNPVNVNAMAAVTLAEELKQAHAEIARLRAARPSEGPETGRPPVDGKPSNCPLCGGEAYATRTVNGTQMFKVGCASCGIELKAAWYRDQDAPTKDILTLWNSRAALPAGPETGDRERLRAAEAAELSMARGFIELWDSIDVQDADDWMYVLRNRAEVLVRQAAPAASEGQK